MAVEQDPEYLHEAHVVLCRALADGDGKFTSPDDWMEVATDLLDALQAAGWALVTEQDFDAMQSAYVMQALR